jgi:hypothetical protein
MRVIGKRAMFLCVLLTTLWISTAGRGANA